MTPIYTLNIIYLNKKMKKSLKRFNSIYFEILVKIFSIKTYLAQHKSCTTKSMMNQSIKQRRTFHCTDSKEK